jgi:type 1 glutamine amidotransferase
MHPPIDSDRFKVHPDVHPIAQGVPYFTSYDERYSYLVPHRDFTGYLTHDLDGSIQPLAWATVINGSRIVYNALGHSTKSYDSPERIRLLEHEIAWCLNQL